MKKILILGQAPPAREQKLPYDTTMLYIWLKEIGISKDDAQQLFDFDAVYDKFPGYLNGNHAVPTDIQMNDYWNRSLEKRFFEYDKVLILGNVAWDFINSKLKYTVDKPLIFKTMHPSRMNYKRYIQRKKEVLATLKNLIS